MIRIIVVEDDPIVAQLNAAYLDRLEGFSVRGIFPNGQQALEFLRENPVELAIVDVYMPVCSGVELLRRMRSTGIQTAVIMITAATEMKVVDEALRLGIEDYIIKPFSYDRLRESVLRFRDKTSLVQQSQTASQAMVDQLLGNQPRRSADTPLPKGLNAKTLAAVRSVLDQEPGGNHTCESLSAASGLSKVTVRHYLNYLIDTGTLTSAIDYETGGRPRVLYRLK
ncbi:MAG: response regulator [Ruminococcaceae bacterium]|nr:response regulator [Oscillospiraceae bacterium]